MTRDGGWERWWARGGYIRFSASVEGGRRSGGGHGLVCANPSFRGFESWKGRLQGLVWECDRSLMPNFASGEKVEMTRQQQYNLLKEEKVVAYRNSLHVALGDDLRK